jgi:hypothetical protein
VRAIAAAPRPSAIISHEAQRLDVRLMSANVAAFRQEQERKKDATMTLTPASELFSACRMAARQKVC